ncbi:MAG: substrate-binding domain-containing protein, partial [Eubacteriales bacterium]|nr:substrate-binding domain-containing protein [Eubacteriales bacterium]
LKSLNYSVPKDTLVSGFDNSLESKIIEPNLTTISIPASHMGIIASNIILTRIKNNDLPFTKTYVDTEIIFRKSTNN